MAILKVEDNEDLVRNVETSAILNTNTFELHKHRARRKLFESKDLQLYELTSKVEALQAMVNNLLNSHNKDILE